MSSYDSSDSKSDNYLSNDDNDSESITDDNDDLDERAKKKKSSAKKSSKNSKSLKRPAQDYKLGHDAKKSKTGNSEKQGSSSDKKQMIKDQLKLLESALKKKSMAK